MLIVLGVVLVLLGAWHLLAPRSSALVRRSAGPGRHLSRSQLSAARTRGAAVAVLGLFALVLSPVASTPASEPARSDDAAQAAWGLDTSMAPGRVRLLDVPVVSPSEAPELVPPEAPGAYTPALRFGVVGSSEQDPRVELPGVAHGDLLVLVTPGGCEVTRVLVDEDEASVRLTVVVEPPLFGRPPPYPTGIPAIDWPSLSPAPEAGPEADEPFQPRCTGRPVDGQMALAPTQLLRVPLDHPLDDRRVVDGPQGTDVPPVVPVA